MATFKGQVNFRVNQQQPGSYRGDDDVNDDDDDDVNDDEMSV